MRRLRGIVVAVVLLAASRVEAQPTSNDKAVAVKLFDEGIAAFKSKDLTSACAKLAESQRLDPALGTLMYLSECQARRGLTASAWAGFRQAADLAQRIGDKREASARDRVAELEPRLAMITIDVPSEARLPGLVVERDGQRVAEVTWGMSVPIDPGEHRIAVSARGFKEYGETVLVEGEGARVTVAIHKLPKLASSTPSALPPPKPVNTAVAGDDGVSPAPATPASSPWRTVGYVASGVGLAGLVVGGLLIRSAGNMGDDARAQHDPGLYDDARSRQTLGRISLGAGAALLGAGVVLVLTASASGSGTTATTRSLSAHPLIGTQSWGVGVNGAW
jgi:hypothetical protein